MWAIPTGIGYVLKKKKKKSGSESQYMVSRPELGSDPPIGSGRDSGRDRSFFAQLTNYPNYSMFSLFKFQIKRIG